MNKLKQTLLTCLLFCSLWTGLLAQDKTQRSMQRVETQVTAVSGRNVFVDKGRKAGFAPGDILTLFPAGQAPVQAEIKVVSRNNSRAELPAGVPPFDPGTRGEVLVPKSRLQKSSPKDEAIEEPKNGAQEDLPWRSPLGQLDPEQPLLAPAFGQGPAARPIRLRGRVFSQGFHTWDNEMGSNRYLLARTGTDLEASNLLGYGGNLNFRGDLSYRETKLDNTPGDYSADGRLDRLSYQWGDTADSPVRFQVGRFLQTLLPELGEVDGVEADISFGESGRLGLSLGAFPEPFHTTSTGDSFQSSLLYQYAPNEGDFMTLGLGLQKTWHRGSPDRDLLVSNLDLYPTDALSLHSSVWVDYYGDRDQIKSKGLQVTQLQTQGNYRINQNHGLGFSFFHVRWPELLRDEFNTLPPDQIRDNRTLRLGLNSWHNLGDHLRVNTRLDRWEDQMQNGYGGDLRFGMRNWLYERGEVATDFFYQEGSFNTGYGIRLSATRNFNWAYVDLRYEWSKYDNEPLNGATDKYSHQSISSSANFILGRGWDLNFSMDYRFGDFQDAFTLSFFFQKHF